MVAKAQLFQDFGFDDSFEQKPKQLRKMTFKSHAAEYLQWEQLRQPSCSLNSKSGIYIISLYEHAATFLKITHLLPSLRTVHTLHIFECLSRRISWCHSIKFRWLLTDTQCPPVRFALKSLTSNLSHLLLLRCASFLPHRFLLVNSSI